MKKFSGELIKAARTGLGMSQQELAEKLGVSVKTIWNWEAGKSFPGVDELPQLAEALDRSMEWFFGQS